MANETLTDVFSDIADAIRAKGVTGQMKPTEMPTKVAAIPQSAVAGDPRFDVDANGQLSKKNTDLNWFGDVKTIDDKALQDAYRNSNVVTAEFPELEYVKFNGMSNAFQDSKQLKSVSFPKLTRIDTNGFTSCFRSCSNLSAVYMPNLSSTDTNAFS